MVFAQILRTGCLGALIVGALGFAAGFLGPMLFAPEANQGPMLGIFITGPTGAFAGMIGGIALGLRKTNRGTSRS